MVCAESALGAHSARRHFGLFITLRAAGCDCPGVQSLLQLIECVVGPALGRCGIEQPVGKPQRKLRAQCRFCRGRIAPRMGRTQGRKQALFRRPVNADRLGQFPVGRDLQDGRSAQAAMREEHFFPKAALAAAHDHWRGNSGQVGEMRVLRAREGKRNQRRTAGFEVNAKLAGDIVAEPCSADLRNRQPAGGYNERRAPCKRRCPRRL